MTKGQIARMVTMIVIAVVLVLSVWGYGSEIGKVVNPIEYSSDVNIDGTYRGPIQGSAHYPVTDRCCGNYVWFVMYPAVLAGI